MKQIKIILIFILAIPVFGVAEEVENTLDEEFYESIMEFEGQSLKGVDKEGKACHILIRRLTDEWADPIRPIRKHVTIHLMMTSEKLTDQLLEAKTEDDHENIMVSNYGYFPYDFSFERSQVGWCSSCGTSDRAGRVKQKFLSGKKYLGFYSKGSSPVADDARIYLSKDGKSIKEVQFIEYRNVYFPGFSPPKLSESVCTIEK